MNYFFRGIGFARTGVLGIVGVCASFPKKLDPDGDLFATLILVATPEEALSKEIVGRDGALTAAVAAI